MLELEDAVARILAAIPEPSSESIPLREAHGRILREEIVAPIDLPGFDNSSVDGYAVKASEVSAASASRPVRLGVAARVAAGEIPAAGLSRGQCARLFTGAPLPPGADAVVMQEDTRMHPDHPGEVWIHDPVKPWENVRFRGEDIRAGTRLAAPGEILGAAHQSLLAAVGIAVLTVGRRPVVGLLATGSELQEPGQPLSNGRIYESNRIGLASLAASAGAVVRVFPIVPDSLEETLPAIVGVLEHCDAVVTTGGVSVGEMDYVKAAWTKLGGSMDFWKVSIKPGRPFAFGRRGKNFLFGLPGNPVSAFVTFLLLVRPALRRWQGAAQTGLASQSARMSEALSNAGSRRHFMRVKVDASGAVHDAGTQASHILSSLAGANGLLDVAPQTTLAAGSSVSVLRWE